jgi:hypothetical protein
MSYIIRIALYFAASFVGSLTQAEVMSMRAEKPDWFKTVNGNSSWNITLDGEIDSNAATRLADLLKKVGNDGVDVYINSPGGNLFVGMQMGRLIHNAGGSTWIGTLKPDPNNSFRGYPVSKRAVGSCHSACSLAFLGGVYRFASDGDAYGVHRFSSKSTPTLADLDKAQVISAAVSAYIREMDVDPALFDLMVEKGKDELRILTNQELAKLNVVNNGRQKADWSIESVAGGEYLRGMQETVYGLGKAIFLCHKKRIGYYSFYQAGAERAKSIASGGWHHSLLVDGKTIALAEPAAAKAAGEEISAEFPLTRDQALLIASSSKIGHAMQVDRDAPTFVGYHIDIPEKASRKVYTFITNCYTVER